MPVITQHRPPHRHHSKLQRWLACACAQGAIRPAPGAPESDCPTGAGRFCVPVKTSDSFFSYHSTKNAKVAMHIGVVNQFYIILNKRASFGNNAEIAGIRHPTPRSTPHSTWTLTPPVRFLHHLQGIYLNQMLILL